MKKGLHFNAAQTRYPEQNLFKHIAKLTKNDAKRAKTNRKLNLYRLSENTKANLSPEISVEVYRL